MMRVGTKQARAALAMRNHARPPSAARRPLGADCSPPPIRERRRDRSRADALAIATKQARSAANRAGRRSRHTARSPRPSSPPSRAPPRAAPLLRPSSPAAARGAERARTESAVRRGGQRRGGAGAAATAASAVPALAHRRRHAGAFAKNPARDARRGEKPRATSCSRTRASVCWRGLTAPRLVLRFTSAMPAAVPSSFSMQTAASAGHALMYAFLVGMPATGFVMGYFGGRALPFFTTPRPGAATRDTPRGTRFQIHKQMREHRLPARASPRASARWVCTRSGPEHHEAHGSHGVRVRCQTRVCESCVVQSCVVPYESNRCLVIRIRDSRGVRARLLDSRRRARRSSWSSARSSSTSMTLCQVPSISSPSTTQGWSLEFPSSMPAGGCGTAPVPAPRHAVALLASQAAPRARADRCAGRRRRAARASAGTRARRPSASAQPRLWSPRWWCVWRGRSPCRS